MNLILKRVGDNKVKVIKVLRDVSGMTLQEAKEIVDKVQSGEEYSIEGIREEDMQSAVKLFMAAGAEVMPPEGFVMEETTEETEDGELAKKADKIFEKVGDIIGSAWEWHEKLFNKYRVLAIIFFIIEGLGIIVLLYNFWEFFAAILLIMSFVFPFIYKKDYTDKDRENVKDIIGAIVKWLVIIVLVIVLWKPVTNLIKPGAAVRNAYFLSYSDEITIGEAFENVFTDCKWSKYTYNDNKYVSFTGNFKDDNGTVSTYQFNFLVLGDSVMIDSIYVEGVDVSWMETVLLVSIYTRNGVTW